MFSAKNYGLPKDLIEAAKRVHEKQLEENLDKRIKKPKNKYPDFTKLSRELDPTFKEIEKQRKKDLNSEEVQFTEEELAEAFAIFLEENFHVEMLTEEDLDYVFENEFPQWLEEVSGNTGVRSDVHKGDTGVGGNISTGQYQARSAVKKAIRSGTLATKGSGQTGIISKMKDKYGTAAAVKSDTMGGHTSAPKPAAPKPAVRKPALNARRPAPKIDYKTPVTKRGPDGTYGLTDKGRRYVARKEAKERARTAASDAKVKRTGRGRPSWAEKAFTSEN